MHAQPQRKCKDVARWLGMRQMLVCVMLPRIMLKQYKLLNDQKNDLNQGTVSTLY
jgi:hypothetical protein